MQSQLAAMGYRVDIARNGNEAISKYQPSVFDLILTDLDMPEMDGYEMTAEIRRQEEENQSKVVPIIAITASEYDLTEEKARAMGFSGYLLKPLEPDVFKKKLAAL